MKQKARVLLPIVVVAIAALVAALLLRARPAVERQESAVPPPLVRVVEVRKTDIPLRVASQGTVQPRTESVLVAQVGGRVIAVGRDFAAGGFFSPDDLLVKIDPRDYELAVEQAEARLAQARVRLDLERAETEIARTEWEELGEGEPSALTLREPQLAEAQASLQAAHAALEQARLQLDRTEVRAPFAGRVRQKSADVGQFVAPGTPLASVYSTDAAEIVLPVPKHDLAFLELDLGGGGGGPEVALRGELGGERRSWPARVVRVGSEFDPKTRMLPLYARVDDPFARRRGTDHTPLPMGLFVEARISGRLAEGVVSLPRSALRGDDQVVVVDDDSRLRLRRVRLLRVHEDRAIVRDGLGEGEKVCVSQLEAVVDGMRVRTVLEPDAEPLPEADAAALEDRA